MPQGVETREGRYPGSDTRFAHRPGLMRLQPLAPIPLYEDPFDSGPACTQRVKLPDALFRQDDMPPMNT